MFEVDDSRDLLDTIRYMSTRHLNVKFDNNNKRA